MDRLSFAIFSEESTERSLWNDFLLSQLHLTAFPLCWLRSFDCKYRLLSVPGRTTVMHSKISLAVFVKRFLVRSLVTWTTLAWSFKMTSQWTSVLLSHHQQTTNCLGQTRGPKTRTRLRMKVKYSRYIKQRLIWRWRRTGPAGREVVIVRQSRSTVRARQENTRHNSSVKFKMADMFTTPEWSLSGLMRTLEEGRNRQWQLTEEEKTVPLSWSKQRLQVQVLQNLTERLSGFIFPPLIAAIPVKLNQIIFCFVSTSWCDQAVNCAIISKTESNSNVPPPLNAGLCPCHHRWFFFLLVLLFTLAEPGSTSRAAGGEAVGALLPTRAT